MKRLHLRPQDESPSSLDILGQSLEQTPRAPNGMELGFDLKTMRRHSRLLDFVEAVPESAESMDLEDADAEMLQQVFGMSRWQKVHLRILEVADDLDAMEAVEPATQGNGNKTKDLEGVT